MADGELTRMYEIHPAIGIARLGVSDQFFIGPEPLGSDDSQWEARKYAKRDPLEPMWDAEPAAGTTQHKRTDVNRLRIAPSYRDDAQRLKRQAVRFRVYDV